MGLGGKRPESTDTDDGQDGNTPPRSPAPSDVSDSDLSLGTNSPPPPTTSSQSSLSPSSHPHPALHHAFSSLSSLSSFSPTIPIPVASLPLPLSMSSSLTPTPAHMTTIPALPPHHIPHHGISPSAIFPTLASLHGFTSAMSMTAGGAGKGLFGMPLELHRPFLKQNSPERPSSS